MKHISPITYNLYDDNRKECNGMMCRHNNCKCTFSKVLITPFTLLIDVFYFIPHNINRAVKHNNS